MNKIIKIHTNEIIIRQEEMSKLLNKACSRKKTPMKITGCCKSGEVLMICLEENNSAERFEYVFAQFPSSDTDDIIGEISSRYFAGFSTISSFDIQDLTYGLFAKSKE